MDITEICKDETVTVKHVLVFFHIYYIELIDEYIWYMNNIKKSDYTFDLYVSICKDVSNDNIISKLTQFKSDVKITYCENQGADVGGFFSTLRNPEISINLESYNAWLFLHTKKSNQLGREISYYWRGQLLNDTLICPELVNTCIEKITNENIGIVASNRCIYTIKESLIYYKAEKEMYDLLCKRFKINHIDDSNFVGGTIFWANMNILKLITASDIVPEDFEKKFEHVGLLQHGFERMFGNLSAFLNLPILGINLNIDNSVYHSSFRLYEFDYTNTYTFNPIKNNDIIFPNYNSIRDIKNDKLHKKRFYSYAQK